MLNGLSKQAMSVQRSFA